MGSVGEQIVGGLHDNTGSVDWDFESIPQAQVVVEDIQTSPSSCFQLPLGNSLRIYSVGNKWIEIQLLYCFTVAIMNDFSCVMAVGAKGDGYEGQQAPCNNGQCHSFWELLDSRIGQTCGEFALLCRNCMLCLLSENEAEIRKIENKMSDLKVERMVRSGLHQDDRDAAGRQLMALRNKLSLREQIRELELLHKDLVNDKTQNSTERKKWEGVKTEMDTDGVEVARKPDWKKRISRRFSRTVHLFAKNPDDVAGEIEKRKVLSAKFAAKIAGILEKLERIKDELGDDEGLPKYEPRGQIEAHRPPGLIEYEARGLIGYGPLEMV